MHKKKNSQQIVSIVLSISIILLFLNGYSISADMEVSSGDWFSYDVLTASDTVNDFFGTFPPGTYYGNWSVVVDDKINFNITSVQDGAINGTLFFGNEIDSVIFYDVRNRDTAFGLGLGIYPWNGGFIANSSDWDNIITSIQGTNTTVTHIDSYNHTVEGVSDTYSVVHFNTSNYYGQFSSFFYHKNSGILLKAYTSFGLYELEIALDTTNLNLEIYTETATTSTLIMLFSLIQLPALYVLKKRQK